jgi:uncharacterized membrane protein
MAFCPQCGAEVQGSFCPACGAHAKVPATAPPLGDHVIHALCYALGPLTGILFLTLDPYRGNRATRFHALQSIVVFSVWFLSFVLFSMLAYVPGVGLLFTLATLLLPLVGFAAWLFLIFKAYNKERFVVPILGTIAETQA